MKRRPRKFVTLLIFLLLGAIVNIAVAWGPYALRPMGSALVANGYWTTVPNVVGEDAFNIIAVAEWYYESHELGVGTSWSGPIGEPHSSCHADLARLRNQHAVLRRDPVAAAGTSGGAAALAAHQSRPVPRVRVSRRHQRPLHRVRQAGPLPLEGEGPRIEGGGGGNKFKHGAERHCKLHPPP